MNFQSELSTDLKISRIITGLWQIADIEREEEIDPKAYAEKLIPYIEDTSSESLSSIGMSFNPLLILKSMLDIGAATKKGILLSYAARALR